MPHIRGSSTAGNRTLVSWLKTKLVSYILTLQDPGASPATRVHDVVVVQLTDCSVHRFHRAVAVIWTAHTAYDIVELRTVTEETDSTAYTN